MDYKITKHTHSFNRKALRKVHLRRALNGPMILTTYTLDRASLEMHKVESLFTDEGLQLVCMMYYQSHINDSGVRVNAVEERSS